MTLSAVATITRRFIFSSILFSVLGLASFIGYKIWYAHYLSTLPPVEEKPDLKFGVLPQLDFPPSAVSSSNFSYSLDTTTGGLPTFDKIIRVYFLPRAFTTLLAPDKAGTLSQSFNIESPPEIISETRYVYKNDFSKLTIELDTGNFLYTASSSATPSAKVADNQLIENFRNFLSNKNLLKEDLSKSPAKVSSDIVSLWPSDIDQKKVITKDFNRGLIWAQVQGGGTEIQDYLILNYTYWNVDLLTFATYPLKTSAQAFEDLRSGQGVVIVEPEKPQVSITSMYLAYYQSENYSPYLQPVFVFEGPSFVAYVNATVATDN